MPTTSELLASMHERIRERQHRQAEARMQQVERAIRAMDRRAEQAYLYARAVIRRGDFSSAPPATA